MAAWWETALITWAINNDQDCLLSIYVLIVHPFLGLFFILLVVYAVFDPKQLRYQKHTFAHTNLRDMQLIVII